MIEFNRAVLDRDTSSHYESSSYGWCDSAGCGVTYSPGNFRPDPSDIPHYNPAPEYDEHLVDFGDGDDRITNEQDTITVDDVTLVASGAEVSCIGNGCSVHGPGFIGVTVGGETTIFTVDTGQTLLIYRDQLGFWHVEISYTG